MPAGQLAVLIVLLGAVYGVCMATFAVVSGRGGGWPQMAAAAVKVPALFLLTLGVTFPSLYTFNALVGSRLTLLSLLRLLVASISVMLALLASFGTIVAFFSFTTESYAFMVLLNVAFFGASGLLGLKFLLQTLHRLTLGQTETAPPRKSPPPPPLPAQVPPEVAAEVGRQTLEHALAAVPDAPPSDRTRLVFKIWLVLFALVGTQMSWVLRPFIGSGDTFALFRPKASNFFEAVSHAARHVLGM